MKSTLVRWGGVALMIGTLAGCGGGGSSDTTAAAPPAAVVPPVVVAPAAVPVPTGAAPVTLTAATPAATFAALAPVVPAVSVTIASPPKVTFSMTDAAGNGIIGFGTQSKDLGCVRAGTAASSYPKVPCYPNLAFALAKYVPGTPVAGTTTTTPGKWVSYIVTTVPTASTASTGTRPSTDNNGTLVDNKNGTYTYTFYRDITTIKDQVAAMTLTGANVAADLGDLTFDKNALHRLTIQISGSAPGTGTNTADGVQTITAVSMRNPINVIYDFIPATGKAVASTDATVQQRLVVDKASCNDCHAKLGGIPGTESASFHGGSRYDPKYCVVCHTDQRKYGQARAVSTSNAFPAIVKNASGTITSAATYVADGVTIGDFPVLIHRVHKGEELVKKNYNYAGVELNETKFPQDLRNCTTCHDNTAPKVAPQGDNYKMVPSRLACGACHDGINFATGSGTTNNGKTGGHIGGVQADDSRCALCHDAASIQSVYHIPVTPPNPANKLLVAGGTAYTNSAWIASNRSNLPPGAIKVDYDIKSVSRNASKQPVIVFRMLQNGARKDFNDPTAKTELWDNFFGAPSVYFVWAVPQDGITAPADFNANASGWLKSIWNGTATGTSAGTLSAADADGYYTATLTGITVPDAGVMLSGGMGYTYTVGSTPPLTQTNVAETIASNNGFGTPRFGVGASTIQTTGENKTGGLVVVTPDMQKVATGYTGRRAIVDDALCNKCHKELGMFTAEAFHAGQRNDGSTCAWCHRPNQTSSAWSADSISFVHAIHGKERRAKPFTWHAVVVGKSFGDIGYPGILSKCETCHLAGTYDFSATGSAVPSPNNRLYRTVGVGKYNGTVAGSLTAYSTSPYVTADNVVDYGTGPSYSAAAGTITAGAGTTLVISPIATACFSCHDSDVAKQHMESNGASIYAPRTTALAKSEQCMFCHQPTSAFGLGIKAVHNK